MDGGYLRTEDIEEAHAQGAALFVPPKPARNPEKRGRELEPKPGDSAAVLTSNGTRFMPPHSVVSMQALALPFLCGLAAFSDANVSLRYVGTETVAGQLAHRVDMAREPGPGDPLAAPRRLASHMTVWISTTTGLPVQIAATRIANASPTAATTTIRVFSDYRSVSGIAVPFHQEEYGGGHLLYTLQLATASFNVGLSDGEFALPPQQ
jgi:hypothetical protein